MMRRIITVMTLTLLLIFTIPAHAEFLYPTTAADVPLPPIPLDQLPVITDEQISREGFITVTLDAPLHFDALTAGLPESSVRFGIQYKHYGETVWVDLALDGTVATCEDPNLGPYSSYAILLLIDAKDDSSSIELSMRRGYRSCSWHSAATDGDTYTLYYDEDRNITSFSYYWQSKWYDYDYCDWNGERILYRYTIEQPGESDLYALRGYRHHAYAQWTAWGDLLEATVDEMAWSHAYGWVMTLVGLSRCDLPEGETDPRDWQLPVTMERPKLEAIPNPEECAEVIGDFALSWTESNDQLVCIAQLRYDTYLPDWGYEFYYDLGTLDVQMITCPLDMYLNVDFNPDGSVKCVFFDDELEMRYVWTENNGWTDAYVSETLDPSEYPGLLAIGDPSMIECPLPLE